MHREERSTLRGAAGLRVRLPLAAPAVADVSPAHRTQHRIAAELNLQPAPNRYLVAHPQHRLDAHLSSRGPLESSHPSGEVAVDVEAEALETPPCDAAIVVGEQRSEPRLEHMCLHALPETAVPHECLEPDLNVSTVK